MAKTDKCSRRFTEGLKKITKNFRVFIPVKMDEFYKRCTHCIMDTTDPDIEFDDSGVCNHCRTYYEMAKKKIVTGREGEQKLQQIAQEIKEHGKNKKYDCIIGLSGGVDSSFAAYQSKRLGLRPLAVHFDNGWNSEIATRNIENIVRKLNFDLYTYVADWEEFKDLQLSFLKASVVDIDVVTDHAIWGTIYNVAKKKNIRYIISGTNVATEANIPSSWLFPLWDIRNIKAIQKRFFCLAKFMGNLWGRLY